MSFPINTALSLVPIKLLPITTWFDAVSSWASQLYPIIVFSVPASVVFPEKEPTKVLLCAAPSNSKPAFLPKHVLLFPVMGVPVIPRPAFAPIKVLLIPVDTYCPAN